MPDSVNDIIEKLSKIEEAATSVMKNAEAEKTKAQADFAKEKEKFDKELLQKYKNNSEEANILYDKKINARIEENDRSISEAFNNLSDYYEKNKVVWAKEIFGRIIEV